MAATSTYRDTPASNTGFDDGLESEFERETDGEDSTLQLDWVTFRHRLMDALGSSRRYWVPPSPLADPPPSIQDLSAYAHRGAWTKPTGRLRSLGVAWFWAVGLPITVACRYVEWVAQRPGRAIPVLALWWLFRTTGPGPWIDAYLIHPVLDFLL